MANRYEELRNAYQSYAEKIQSKLPEDKDLRKAAEVFVSHLGRYIAPIGVKFLPVRPRQISIPFVFSVELSIPPRDKKVAGVGTPQLTFTAIQEGDVIKMDCLECRHSFSMSLSSVTPWGPDDEAKREKELTLACDEICQKLINDYETADIDLEDQRIIPFHLGYNRAIPPTSSSGPVSGLI